MQLRRLLALAVAVAVGASAQTLADMLAAENATLSILNGFLQQQQALFDTFSSAQDITVLAPSNAALSALGPAVVDRVNSDPNFLNALLSYHVLNGTYYGSHFAGSAPLFIRTLLNDSSYCNVTGGQRVVVRGAEFSSGAQSTATLQAQDFNFTGGTMHIIDAMLAMPSNLTDTLLAANLTAAVGALRQSGLAAALDAQPEVTVFAPDNRAFDVVGSLVAGMTKADLQTVLGYHVLPGKVMYSDLLANASGAATAQGHEVKFRAEGGGLFVNSAKVLVADVLISNGVVHFIDNVLNPSNSAASPNPTASTQAPAFSGASATGGIPFTTGITPPAASNPITATITVAPAVGVTGGAPPVGTAAVGIAALVGGAAVFMNL